MASTSNVQVTISLQESGLDDHELEAQVEKLLPQVTEVDGVEQAEPVPVEKAPPNSKALGGFLLGILTTEVNPANIKALFRFLSDALFRFLSDRFAGKPIEITIKAPDGRKLSIKASSEAEFDFAYQKAQEFLKQDVALIERKVVQQRQRFSAAQLLTRQQFLKLAGLGGVGFVVTVVFQTFRGRGNSPQPKPSSSPLQKATPKELPPLQVFKFNVVTVDAQGKETKRNRKQAEFFTEDLGNGVSLEMVSIPGGKFLMGSPSTEAQRYDYESPQHSVTVAPFFIGKFAVTQAQWIAVASLRQVKQRLDAYPSYFKGANHPVENISWRDAVEFCERLSNKTGLTYRLPREAEWEYACRAGTTTPFHFGETITPALASYDGTSTYGSGPKGEYRQQTTDVGSFQVANAFGLYDMHGNVWEWCDDHWHDNYKGAPSDGSAWLSNDDNQSRLLRGGSWSNNPRNCRSASRNYYLPDSRFANDGFRVVGVRA